MALILNCNITFYILKKPTSNCSKLKFLSISKHSGSIRDTLYEVIQEPLTLFLAENLFHQSDVPLVDACIFKLFDRFDNNGWSFYSYTADLVNNAEECDRRPGKSACWGKILFYDVCKWQASFSLQSKIVFRLTLIRARTDCTVR